MDAVNLTSSIITGIVSSALFLLVLSRLRPRIEIADLISHVESPGRARDRFSIKIRNRTRAQLLDVRVKASFILHYDSTHPRVGRGIQLEFEYPTLFDLAKREKASTASGRSTFEFSFKTPLEPLIALSNDWAIRVAVSSSHSLTGLGAIAKRNLIAPLGVQSGAFSGGTSLAVEETVRVHQAAWHPTSTDEQDLLAVGEIISRLSRIALEASQIDRLALVKTPKGAEFDIVTDADIEIERKVANTLQALYPNDGVIGEERVRIPSRSGAEWIVDPIDGTVNFMSSDRSWSICVARRQAQHMMMAIIIFPELEETYVAIRGKGAFRNGERLTVSNALGVDMALIGTRFGTEAVDRHLSMRVAGQVLSRARDIRRTGCTSLDLANVAAGVTDGYIGRGLGEWDSAPASLLIEEAGGVWSNWAGVSALKDGTFVAGGTAVHGELVEMTQRSES